MQETTCYKPQVNEAAKKILNSLCSVAPLWDEPMKKHSTLRAGGHAEVLVSPGTEEELSGLLRWLTDSTISHRIIGQGSNILVAEKGLPGVTIKLGGTFTTIGTAQPLGADIDPQDYGLEVGAGCSLARLLVHCTKNELGGTEFLIGIPGSIGGAIYMNAGAWNKAVGEITTEVRIIDCQGEITRLDKQEMQFSYRHSIFQQPTMEESIILSVGLKLKKRSAEDISRACKQLLRQRAGKQPSVHGSAGSFFKNPVGDSAGRLIESAGLKGYYRGSAMVSKVHANFIVNTGTASADDISGLMNEVQQRVFAHSGIMLEPEVRFLR